MMSEEAKAPLRDRFRREIERWTLKPVNATMLDDLCSAAEFYSTERHAELVAALDEAGDFIRAAGEELILAGFPGGDRAQIMSNIRRTAKMVAAALRMVEVVESLDAMADEDVAAAVAAVRALMESEKI